MIQPQHFRFRLFAALAASAALVGSAFAQSPFMRMVKPTQTQEILQTKARRYAPATGDGPSVWLVGVAHIGEEQYYKDIQKLLDEQAVVLYEGVSKKGVDPAAPKPSGENDPRKKSTYQILSDALKLQFQLFGIDYSRAHFKNSDMSWEEMQEFEKQNPGEKGKPSLSTIGGMLDSESPQGKMLATFMASIKDDPSSVEAMHIVFIESLSNPKIIEQQLSPGLSNLLIKKRNGKVLGDLKGEMGSSPKSIAIFYGAGHMADMEQRLVGEFGYKGAEERWFTAMKGDTSKVTGNGAMILQMMRSQLQPAKAATPSKPAAPPKSAKPVKPTKQPPVKSKGKGGN